MCPLRRSAKPGMEWYLLAASAESMRAVPSSNSTIFSPLSQCSPWLPRNTTRDWFHSPTGRRCFAPLGATRSYSAKHLRPVGEWNRSEEHTSELQSPYELVCRLLLEKKK